MRPIGNIIKIVQTTEYSDSLLFKFQDRIASRNSLPRRSLDTNLFARRRKTEKRLNEGALFDDDDEQSPTKSAQEGVMPRKNSGSDLALSARFGCKKSPEQKELRASISLHKVRSSSPVEKRPLPPMVTS